MVILVIFSFRVAVIVLFVFHFEKQLPDDPKLKILKKGDIVFWTEMSYFLYKQYFACILTTKIFIFAIIQVNKAKDFSLTRIGIFKNIFSYHVKRAAIKKIHKKSRRE